MNEANQPPFTANELENSFPIDLGRRFRNAEECEFLNTIIDGMRAAEKRKRARKPEDEIRWLASIQALLANLVAGHLNVIDRNRFVAVSFDRNAYNGAVVSLVGITQCKDYLLAQGYIEIAQGYYRLDRSGVDFFGRRSRLRATTKLRKLMDANEVNRRSLTRPVSDLIQIKKPIKGLGGIPKEIEESRAILEAVNTRLADTNIKVHDAFVKLLENGNVESEGEAPDELNRKRAYAGDFTATSLYRVFKYDWKKGGRIYGGWWMSVPKIIRKHLTINNLPVVELDFGTMHPALLYRRIDKDCPPDPYTVPGWESPNMRKLGKRTFNRLLNRKEGDPHKRLQIRAANGDRELLIGSLPFKTYLSSFIHGLKPIHPWLGTGIGIELQYEDSLLALRVLSAMEAANIAVLPIHDSFIVAMENEAELRSAMEIACSEYGLEPRISRQAI